MITVVGVGIKRGDITKNGQKAIKAADRVFSRAPLWIKTENLAKIHAGLNSYDSLDAAIASEIIKAAENCEKVVYCAIGDGFTDSVVSLLQESTQVEIIAGVSEYRGRSAGSRLLTVGAYDIVDDTLLDTTADLMVYGIDDAFIASELKLRLSSSYDDEQTCVFSTDDDCMEIKLYELDRMKKYKYSSLFISGNSDLIKKQRYGLSDLITVMNRLTSPDGGCPWDMAQTHESIRINMLEEAYEAVDAINNGDVDNLREELGDVLLQVIFHCDMAKRGGEFTLGDVVNELVEKLVSRHTHIFGENRASDAQAALKFWEAAKAKEKHYSTLSEQLDRIPDAFPATLTAQKAIKKAAKAGARITVDAVVQKLKTILSDAPTAQNAGKLLLLAVAFTSICGVDGEIVLGEAVAAFIERVKEAEKYGTLPKVDDLL